MSLRPPSRQDTTRLTSDEPQPAWSRVSPAAFASGRASQGAPRCPPLFAALFQRLRALLPRDTFIKPGHAILPFRPDFGSALNRLASVLGKHFPHGQEHIEDEKEIFRSKNLPRAAQSSYFLNSETPTDGRPDSFYRPCLARKDNPVEVVAYTASVGKRCGEVCGTGQNREAEPRLASKAPGKTLSVGLNPEVSGGDRRSVIAAVVESFGVSAARVKRGLLPLLPSTAGSLAVWTFKSSFFFLSCCCCCCCHHVL